MPITVLGGTKVADTAFSVANSCRFDKGDAPELNRSTGDGNERIGNFSFWWKNADPMDGSIFYNVYTDANDFFSMGVDGSMNFEVVNKAGGSYNMEIKTNRMFRDPSAWYHICVLIDTTQSTNTNRVKIYVNGVQETSFATSTYPDQNTDLHMNSNSETARISPSQNRIHGYLAEFVAIDGTVKVIGDFGEFDEDTPTTWKPKDVSGLSGDKGTNGFYLDFEDSSNLGNCAFDGTDFTESNLAATDQMTDSPTNNFCVINSLFFGSGLGGNDSVSITRGNLVAHDYSGIFIPCTFFVNKGKWYWENKIGSQTDAQYTAMGIASESVVSSSDMEDAGTAGGHSLFGGDDLAISYYGNNGYTLDNDSTQAYGDTYGANDIISVALDLDNNKLYFAKNGTWLDSGDPTSGSTGTGAISITNTYYTPMTGGFSGDMDNSNYNFGGGTTWAVSSANSDANDGGTTFEYAPPSGYYALCTKNLAEFG
jgi:hypothetical protein